MLISRPGRERESFFSWAHLFFISIENSRVSLSFFFLDGLLPPSPFLLLLFPPLSSNTHTHTLSKSGCPSTVEGVGLLIRRAKAHAGSNPAPLKNWCYVNTTNDYEKNHSVPPPSPSLACEEREKRNAKAVKRKENGRARGREKES